MKTPTPPRRRSQFSALSRRWLLIPTRAAIRATTGLPRLQSNRVRDGGAEGRPGRGTGDGRCKLDRTLVNQEADGQ